MDLQCYQKMYATLCAAASDAVEALKDPSGALYARTLLKKALLAAEDIYINHEEQEL